MATRFLQSLFVLISAVCDRAVGAYATGDGDDPDIAIFCHFGPCC
ncbi:hypothetical protein [Oceanibaculum pacificum]|nr:hypothetical protein [Oceanibaculum pacificum]